MEKIHLEKENILAVIQVLTKGSAQPLKTLQENTVSIIVGFLSKSKSLKLMAQSE